MARAAFQCESVPCFFPSSLIGSATVSYILLKKKILSITVYLCALQCTYIQASMPTLRQKSKKEKLCPASAIMKS